jgi:hypothetical protein
MFAYPRCLASAFFGSGLRPRRRGVLVCSHRSIKAVATAFRLCKYVNSGCSAAIAASILPMVSLLREPFFGRHWAALVHHAGMPFVISMLFLTCAPLVGTKGTYFKPISIG